MRIDEFEFQDKNGNEIEPTKDQLVIYIRSLHEQIKNLKIDLKDYMELEEKISTKYDNVIKQFKDFKNSQNQIIIDELEKFKNYIFTRIYLTANGDEEKINTYVDLKIKNLKGE